MTNLERLRKALAGEPVDRLLTWDFLDNEALLVKHGGYVRGTAYRFEDLVEMNARTFKAIGLDMTRFAYDPAHHWMGSKIGNWIRFFGMNPADWDVQQAGGTAWIAKRPFDDLKGLETHMPRRPRYEDVRAWLKPTVQCVKSAFDRHDLVWIGGVEGPLTDAYTFTDMQLFMLALYDAPELIGHVMDCAGEFSACMARVYAECPTAPLLFMGEDICGVSGPMFSPDLLRREALPRWRWIRDPIREKGHAFLFHTDGRYGAALPIILEELGADGLHPIERNGLNDIFEIHRRYPRTRLFGNVCCAVTLPFGNRYDVEDETLELIERIGPDGGLFIGSSSEVHDLVPVENAETLYRTVHEYGTFPIDVDRIRRRRSEIRDRLHTRADAVSHRT
jgi:uroporphyrinogen-III decarboxylase